MNHNRNIYLHIEHPQAVAKSLRHKGTDLHTKQRISVFEITPEIFSFQMNSYLCYHAIKICILLIFLSWIFISTIESHNSLDVFFFFLPVINFLGTPYLQNHKGFSGILVPNQGSSEMHRDYSIRGWPYGWHSFILHLF